MEQNNLKGINYADLEALEQERQDIGKKLSKILFYGIGGAVVGGIFLASIKLGNLFIFLLVGVVAYLGKTTIELKNNFRANFKQKVVTAIVKNYGLNFNANGSLSVYDFYQIYDTDVSEYRGEDLIFGKVDNTEFKLCDFYAAKVTKSGKHTHTTVKFEGILLKAEFKKELNATIYVCDKKSISSLKSEGELAVMDNPKFNELFKTYTTDQIAARYALSPKLMENFNSLRTKFNAPLSAVFLKNEIFIAIDLRKDSFEPDMQKPITSNESIQSYIAGVSDFVEIVHDLELNKNIWKS